MATLVLLKYNNYYNRTVKREFMLDQYRQYQMGEDIQNVNFIPNDYIETEQVINWTSNETPDYLLVLDEYGVIQSRWFIISDTRLTAGQLRLQLRRDLIVDYYYSILNSPCFIEKATVNNINDPAIFNRENMSFNQIKQAEYPLKDRSNTAWIVGYIPSDSFETATAVDTSYNYTELTDIEVASLDKYEYYDYTQYGSKEFKGVPFDVRWGVNTYLRPTAALNPGAGGTDQYFDATVSMDQNGNYVGISGIEDKSSYSWPNVNYSGDRSYRYTGDSSIYIDVDSSTNPPTYKSLEISLDGSAIFRNFTSSVMADMNSYQTEYLQTNSQTAYNNFIAENGKIIKNQADGQYYQVVVTQLKKETFTTYIAANEGPSTLFYNNLNQSLFSGSINNQTFSLTGSTYYYKIDLQVLATKINTQIPAKANRYHLNDSPYDMFCIPFPAKGQKLTIYNNGQVYIDNVDREASFRIATDLAAKLGKDNIYDVQLLPYCPLQTNIIKANGDIDVKGVIHNPINIIAEGGTVDPSIAKPASVMFWAISSEFTVDIPFSIQQSTTIEEKKVKNETEFWRLCSPNYSGVFEFNPEKNGGVSTIHVDCNYKPFNPYIHASINFSGLYGQDFGDSRGLICGGDFSLPIVTDAWADYQLQNKNYQQMFDREIQNMEVNNSVQKEREMWQLGRNALGAAAGGVAAGMMASGGNPVGAIAGLATSGYSLVSNIRNIQLNQQLRDEALDYKRDMFGYSLQNIQALPQGLAKVSAYTANNKIFPFLEQYSCTDIEKNALRNKIKYNGMTIMRIGTISDFMRANEKTYIKGQLIRIENVAEDFHILNAIADEIYKGVYI